MRGATLKAFALASMMLLAASNSAFSQGENVDGTAGAVRNAVVENLFFNAFKADRDGARLQALAVEPGTPSGNCTVSDFDIPGQKLYVRGSGTELSLLGRVENPAKLGAFIADRAGDKTPIDTAIIIVDDFSSPDAHGHLVFKHTTAVLKGAQMRPVKTYSKKGHRIAEFDNNVLVIEADTEGSLGTTREAIESALQYADDTSIEHVVVNMSFVIIPCALKQAFEDFALNRQAGGERAGEQVVTFEDYYDKLRKDNEGLLCFVHLELTEELNDAGTKPPAYAENKESFCERRGYTQGAANPEIERLLTRLNDADSNAIARLFKTEVRFAKRQNSVCKGVKLPLCRSFLDAVLRPPSIANAPFRRRVVSKAAENFSSVAFVASSGNYALPYPMFPAAWPEVIAVSSCDVAEDGDCELLEVANTADNTEDFAPVAKPRRSDFSNLGTVMAPGASFKTSLDKDRHDFYQGTSFSAPAVSVYLAYTLPYIEGCVEGIRQLTSETALSALNGCSSDIGGLTE